MKLKISVIAVASTLLMSGCVTGDFAKETSRERVAERQSEAAKSFKMQARTGDVTEINEPFLSFKPIKLASPEGAVTMKAANSAFGPSLGDVARQAGYSLVFADGVEIARKVTAEFTKAQPDEVIRTLAFLAGYVAIFDRDTKTVTIADKATYTFKVPPAVFHKLSATYSVGGNPVNNSGGGSSGGGGGGSGGGGGGSGGGSGGGGGGSSMQASFTIAGQEQTSGKDVERLVRDIAGKNAEVTVSELGLISVRSNAQSLKRVSEFLKNFTKDSLTQVEIEASIMDVTLSDDFEFGVDWKRVLGAKLMGADTAVNLAFTPTNIVTPTMQATFTSANISTVISSLRKLTDARIVSQPRILAVNNTPSTFFDGTQLPYLGNLTVTSNGGSNGGTQTSGSTSYAVDGVSFSVQPSVVDAKHVQITLVPVLSNIKGFDNFDLGSSGKLTAPRQSTKQTFMKVMAESGKTVILGGIRYTSEDKTTNAGPVPVLIQGKANNSVSKEIVILLRANVLPAPDYNPLVSESV